MIKIKKGNFKRLHSAGIDLPLGRLDNRFFSTDAEILRIKGYIARRCPYE